MMLARNFTVIHYFLHYFCRLLKWRIGEDFGEFVKLCQFETEEPCSCATFTSNFLIVGCQKFLQIDLKTYNIIGKNI